MLPEAATCSHILMMPQKFLKYVDGNEITKELVIQYRELLEREGSAYSTINLILISINCYFLILGFDLKTTD